MDGAKLQHFELGNGVLVRDVDSTREGESLNPVLATSKSLRQRVYVVRDVISTLPPIECCRTQDR